MTFFYNFIFILFIVIYFPYAILKGKWHRGLLVRLGFFPEDLLRSLQHLASSKNLWFHAVSVGEILAIIGLVEQMKGRFPGHKIILSTVTKTGYALAQSKFSKEDMVIYAPMDFSWVVGKFIHLINPVMYITAETEIWPNLFSTGEKEHPDHSGQRTDFR